MPWLVYILKVVSTCGIFKAKAIDDISPRKQFKKEKGFKEEPWTLPKFRF
jgi:hypothetical protein